jgi:hypothetical protein
LLVATQHQRIVMVSQSLAPNSQIGEIDGNLTGLLATEKGITTPFTVHADSAPVIYLTGDPARTPTFVQFANPDYYLYTGAANCNSPCIYESPAFAWNHGDVSPDINTTWLGMVGPGVEHKGVDHSVWSDHTDIRPTMMELLGLRDDYSHDGRVLFEVLKKDALPDVVRDHLAFYTRLAELYKQINAPVGALGLETLKISTKALASSSPNDKVYKSLEALLQNITTQRNAVASQIINILESAEFDNGYDHDAAMSQAKGDRDDQDLLQQSVKLLKQVDQLAD